MGKEQLQVTLIDQMGNDDSIASAARVSFGKNASHYTKEQNTRLLSYLAKHKHMSPFGHVFLSFHIKAPIFVRAQLVKHKFLRMNEISRRYVDTDIEFYQPDVWRGRSEDKKQGSSGVVDSEWSDWQMYGYSLDTYNDMIDSGVAPEMARMVLPQSLMTEWYWSGSLDAFASMCRLRCASDTQYETRLVAQQIDTVMSDLFPVSWSALMSNP